MIRSLFRDIRFALRLLRKNPALTAVALFTMAVGIAANTVIFSVVHALVIRPLPYPNADRLVEVHPGLPAAHVDRFRFSGPEFEDLRQDLSTLEDAAAWAEGLATFSGGTPPIAVNAAYGSATFLSLFGVQPLHGRLLDGSDTEGTRERTVVLGHDLWKTSFGGDPHLVGRTVTFDGNDVTVVGIMPPGFAFPDPSVQAYLPLMKRDEVARREIHFLSVVARLRPGASADDMQAEILERREAWRSRALAYRKALLEREGRPDRATRPPAVPGFDEFPVFITPLKQHLMGAVRPALLLLQGAVAFVLLIACANVSSLLLSLAEARSAEVAIRTALGATPGRLVRQFLTESLFLGVIGGAFGLLLAQWGLDLVQDLLPHGAPRSVPICLDGTVLAVTLGTSIVTGLVFGLTPALQLRGESISQPAAAGGQRSTTSRARQNVRRALVVAEVAMAVILLAGAGLTVRSFVRLQAVDPGFDPRNMLVFELEPPEKAPYTTNDDLVAFYNRVRDRLAALPDVQAVTWSHGAPPLHHKPIVQPVERGVEGSTVQRSGYLDYSEIVGAGYFSAMGIRVLEGRTFDARDTASTEKVMVVNETMAKRFWPEGNAVGQTFTATARKDAGHAVHRVVGVVADVKQGGLEEAAGAEAYFPSSQLRAMDKDGMRMHSHVSFMLRVGTSTCGLSAAIHREVQMLDPQLPVINLMGLDNVVWEAVARPRFLTTLLVLLALLALVMAAVGIYGVTTHSVHQRTQELGIRIALGAPPRRVLELVLRQGLTLSAAGILLGVAGAVLLAFSMRRAFATILFEGVSLDALTVVSLAGVIAAISTAASYVPALRATRIPPTRAMRG